MLPDLGLADAELIFADWGQPASLVSLTPIYDPQSGFVEATTTSTEIVTIATAPTHRLLQTCAALVPVDAHVFLVRGAEIPSGTKLTSARFEFSGQSFEIQSVESTTFSGVVALICVSDALAI